MWLQQQENVGTNKNYAPKSLIIQKLNPADFLSPKKPIKLTQKNVGLKPPESIYHTK